MIVTISFGLESSVENAEQIERVEKEFSLDFQPTVGMTIGGRPLSGVQKVHEVFGGLDGKLFVWLEPMTFPDEHASNAAREKFVADGWEFLKD